MQSTNSSALILVELLELGRALNLRARALDIGLVSGPGLAIFGFEPVGLGQKWLRACWALGIFNIA